MAGLIEERDFGELVDHLLEVFCGERVGLAVHAVNGCVAKEAVGKARGVAHELAHGGWMVGGNEDHFAVGIHALVDLEVRELGNVFSDGIGGEPLALFVEDHHGDTGDGLGH